MTQEEIDNLQIGDVYKGVKITLDELDTLSNKIDRMIECYNLNNKIIMDRVIAKHISKIINAFNEGKKIERKSLDNPPLFDPYLINNFDVLLHWFMKDPMSLSIKEELKYRPYKNAKEFLNAQKEHGPNVKFKDSYYMPLGFDDIGVKIFGVNYSYPSLKLDYLWQDGTPLGILE